jgi:hypothetical protein
MKKTGGSHPVRAVDGLPTTLTPAGRACRRRNAALQAVEKQLARGAYFMVNAQPPAAWLPACRRRLRENLVASQGGC